MVRMSEACPGQSTNVNWTVAQLRRLLLQPSRRRHAEAAEAQVDGDAALLRLRVLVEAGRAGDRAERARQRRLAAVDVAEHADVEIEHALVHSDDRQVAEIKTINTVIKTNKKNPAISPAQCRPQIPWLRVGGYDSNGIWILIEPDNASSEFKLYNYGQQSENKKTGASFLLHTLIEWRLPRLNRKNMSD